MCGLTLLAAGAGQAFGAEADVADSLSPSVPSTPASASRGAFLPFAQAASVGQRAVVAGMAGYDTARKSGSFEVATELRLWGPIAIRGGAVYTDATGTGALRPSIGARVQLLAERRQGVDGAVGVFYRPEGLTEPEGEIESVLSIGGHARNVYLLGSLLYGQDPDGNERDGEVRAAALLPLRPWLLAGFDSRLRFDLGSNQAKLVSHHEPTRDGVAGPLATVLVGPLALSLQGGASMLRPSGQARTSYGVFVMSGIGTAF